MVAGITGTNTYQMVPELCLHTHCDGDLTTYQDGRS